MFNCYCYNFTYNFVGFHMVYLSPLSYYMFPNAVVISLLLFVYLQ